MCYYICNFVTKPPPFLCALRGKGEEDGNLAREVWSKILHNDITLYQPHISEQVELQIFKNSRSDKTLPSTIFSLPGMQSWVFKNRRSDKTLSSTFCGTHRARISWSKGQIPAPDHVIARCICNAPSSGTNQGRATGYQLYYLWSVTKDSKALAISSSFRDKLLWTCVLSAVCISSHRGWHCGLELG
jgi:hypothetical protein